MLQQRLPRLRGSDRRAFPVNAATLTASATPDNAAWTEPEPSNWRGPLIGSHRSGIPQASSLLFSSSTSDGADQQSKGIWTVFL